MAITRSASALLPASDLVAIRTRLADHYGSELYEADDDRRILCVHVPHAEADPVNDVETSIEYLDATDVEQATHVLLIGTEKIAQVYVQPFKQLMQERLQMDARIAHEWRQRLPGTLAHEFFRDPADPRRRWRLAVRLPVETMADFEDDQLEPLADELGPQVETPRVRGLAAVYLVAARDHVRLDPDLFIQELLKTWKDEERRRRLVAEREREKQVERDRKEAERAKLMAELDETLGRRVARAPLRTHRAPGRLGIGPGGVPRDHIDALPAPGFIGLEAGTRLSPQEPVPAPAPALIDADMVIEAGPASNDPVRPIKRHNERVQDIQSRVDGLGKRAGELTDRPGGRLGRMAEHFVACGFDVLVRPETPGPRIDLAAERPDGDPQRIVVRVEDKLDVRAADRALELARGLDVDQVVVVAETADGEAKRRILATKVQWLTPRDLAESRL